MKTCSKCKVEKQLTEFSKHKRCKDGFRYNCKSCVKAYREANKGEINAKQKDYYDANKDKAKAYREANKDKKRAYNKAYNKANREKLKARSKAWNEANKDKLKDYCEANKDKKRAYNKAWREANKDNIKDYREANKDKRNAQARERRKTDPLFKMKWNLRSRTSQAFRDKGYSKTSKTQEMLGTDWEIVKEHIEKQFTKGMSWKNYGDWHIDHIIPLASANTEEELKKLCHYTNLQPLWALDNIKKGDKIL